MSNQEEKTASYKQKYTVEEFRVMADGKEFEDVVRALTEQMHVLQNKAEAEFARTYGYTIEDGKFRSTFEIVRESGTTEVDVTCTVRLESWDEAEST